MQILEDPLQTRGLQNFLEIKLVKNLKVDQSFQGLSTYIQTLLVVFYLLLYLNNIKIH